MTGARLVLRIGGMTCGNCEKILAKGVRKLDGVLSATASFPRKRLEVVLDASKTTIDQVTAAIEKAGYTVVPAGAHPLANVLPIFLIAVALYFIVKYTLGFDIFYLIPKIDASISLFALFATGLLTSVHCIAMCGGINISQCAAGEGGTGGIARPLLYNLGRVLSYTVIGGIAGGLGSVLFVSVAFKGAVMLAAAGFMVLMGLSMLGWLPHWLVPRMPAKWAAASARAKTGRGPFLVGILNGLIPCGPLQAMQLYALATGSVFLGALSMFVFAMGTVPLMLGAGLAIALLKKRFSRAITRISAVFVILIAAVMIGNAANFFGWNLFPTGSPVLAAAASPTERTVAVAPSATASAPRSGLPASGKYVKAVIENGIQTVEGPVGTSSYPDIVVQAGIPVRFNMKAATGSLNGCNGTVEMSKYNIRKKLAVGDNLFEFTPQTEGTVKYACWMGMITAQIHVVADIGSVI